MPVGTKGTVKTLHPDEVRDLGAQIVLGNTYHLHFRPGDELVARPRRPAPLHVVGRADPHRLRRLPGLLAARHDRARRRRGRHVPQRLRRRRRRGSRPSSRSASRRTSAATSRCASTRCRRRTCRGASSKRRCAARPRGPSGSVDAPRAEGQLRFGITPGRRRPGAAPALDRGDRGDRLRRQRDRRARDRRGPRRDVRDDRLGDGAAPRRQAAVLHGDRRPGRDPRGDRGGDRHVRLRPADAHRPHRQRADRRAAGSTSATRASRATSHRSRRAATALPAPASPARTSGTS